MGHLVVVYPYLIAAFSTIQYKCCHMASYMYGFKLQAIKSEVENWSLLNL